MKRTMTHMGMMTAAAAMIGLDSSAMATNSICSIRDGFEDAGGGSGAGGTMLGKTNAIDDNTTRGYSDDGSGTTGQMQQSMDYGPEDGEQAGDAGEQTSQQDQGADAVEQPDAPTDDAADKSGEED